MGMASGEAALGGCRSMSWEDSDVVRGLEALRHLVVQVLLSEHPRLAGVPGMLATEAVTSGRNEVGAGSGGSGGGYDDADLAASSEENEGERTRLIALVELARQGDADAFGMLYDHY